MWQFLLSSRRKKQKAMKHGATKNIVIAGCEKSPVAVFAPVCFDIDIIFVWFYYSRFVWNDFFCILAEIIWKNYGTTITWMWRGDDSPS